MKILTTPRTFRIAQKRSYTSSQDMRVERPGGSWEMPVWENDQKVGHWLMYQFDPDARD